MKLYISAKCSDLFFGEITNDEDKVIKEYDGYVPEELGIGGGNYVEFEVDLKTGQILNWVPVTEIPEEEE